MCIFQNRISRDGYRIIRVSPGFEDRVTILKSLKWLSMVSPTLTGEHLELLRGYAIHLKKLKSVEIGIGHGNSSQYTLLVCING